MSSHPHWRAYFFCMLASDKPEFSQSMAWLGPAWVASESGSTHHSGLRYGEEFFPDTKALFIDTCMTRNVRATKYRSS